MINEEVFNGWIIKELIGKGGFGSVYLAEKNNFKSAVKQIIIEKENQQIANISKYKTSSEYTEKYLKPLLESVENEINIMENLKGVPGIAIILDHMIRELKDSNSYEILIRMEYLTPLNKYVAQNGFTIGNVLKLGTELAYSMDICNESGILHRDIKDNNILVDKRGNFKLSDFGVSRSLEGLTHASTIVGTFKFMAPEVLNGEPYDNRADIYSLGMVLYQLLNEGKVPGISEMKNIPAPKFGNKELVSIIRKACESDKSNRYSTFKEFYNELKKYLDKIDKETSLKYVLGNRVDETILYENNHDIATLTEHVKKEEKSEPVVDNKIVNNNDKNQKNETVDSSSVGLNKRIDLNTPYNYGKTNPKKNKWILVGLFTLVSIIFLAVLISSLNDDEYYSVSDTAKPTVEPTIESTPKATKKNNTKTPDKKIAVETALPEITFEPDITDEIITYNSELYPYYASFINLPLEDLTLELNEKPSWVTNGWYYSIQNIFVFTTFQDGIEYTIGIESFYNDLEYSYLRIGDKKSDFDSIFVDEPILGQNGYIYYDFVTKVSLQVSFDPVSSEAYRIVILSPY